MDESSRHRVVVVDDHPVIASGLSAMVPSLDVVASYPGVEEFLRAAPLEADVIMLDLQFETREPSTGASRMSGTTAIRAILDAGRGPIVLYTSIAEDMLLAACLAAGATGAVTKSSPPSTIADVVRMVAAGHMWVDPTVAGALSRYGQQRHAGVLSPQQAHALQYRGQGLKQQAIAQRIGVSDPEIVNRYLKSAVEKLADLESPEANASDKHPGAQIDDLARRSGLAGGLVRWKDLAQGKKGRKRPG